MYNYDMDTQEEFLKAYSDNKVSLVVNTGIYRSEVEKKLPKEYHTVIIASTGISVLIMLLAIPMYLVAGWIWAVLTIVGGMVFFIYAQKLNYRVYIISQIKADKEFFDYCNEHSVIRIVENL